MLKTMSLAGLQHMTISAVALGSFDGVHVGHQAILRRAVSIAQQAGGLSAVFTFHPHPGMVTGRNGSGTITTQNQRSQLVETCGIDLLIEHPFTSDFASLSPEQFFEEVLLKAFHVRNVVAGFNYTFGRQASGDTALLKRLGREHQFSVHEIAPVAVMGEIVSSTRVRRLIEQGELDSAAHCLGRRFSLQGEVTVGDGRGRRLGFPTANIRLAPLQVLPPFGVYLVYAPTQGFGVANLGIRPTFPLNCQGLEVHFFGASQRLDLYGQDLEVELVEYLRPERTFSGAQELSEQIEQDIARARTLAYSSAKC
ncbi:MAG: Riboflavin biosynthesis protein RibF [Firmicutes bacterium]|nr:Riboflavin biosynthesis protein RibF [candidate division NPL-UPA2 bacterium]MBT9154411.1 Riboflavin biosynthesis protein RibF [candidate division NPL-UPA2 bacterium]